MPYVLAREEASGPHHAYDLVSRSMVCGWRGHHTVYGEMQFNPAHPYACANCSAAVRVAETGTLPNSSLVPEETVAVHNLDDKHLFSASVRQHELVDLGFSDPPFNQHRLIGHRMHIDVSDEATASAVAEFLPVGASVKVVASAPLPPLVVEAIQDMATMRIDDRVIKRREILFKPA